MTWTLEETRARDKIEAYLRRDALRHLYELCDLEEPHWSRTRWFAARNLVMPSSRSERRASIDALVMLYDAQPMPVFIAMGAGSEADQWLLRQVLPKLPQPAYAHVAEGLLSTVRQQLSTSEPRLHLRMTLEGRHPAPTSSSIRALGHVDLEALQALLLEASPQHYFQPEMLTTGRYFGVFEDGRLISCAGTHLVSRQSRTAALGNIATASAHRGRGLASRVTAALCVSLAPDIDLIGLNVHVDNTPAIRCYERLGFKTAAQFYELMIGQARVP